MDTWHGVAMSGGEANLLGISSANAHRGYTHRDSAAHESDVAPTRSVHGSRGDANTALASQHDAHLMEIDRRQQLTSTRSQRAMMNALYDKTQRDTMRHELSELSSEFVGSILLRRAAADAAITATAFTSTTPPTLDTISPTQHPPHPNILSNTTRQKTRTAQTRAATGNDTAKSSVAFVCKAPSAREGMNDTVWVMGGWNGSQLLATVEYLDTRTSQWVRGPSLPQPRRGACSVSIGSRLLIFGGWDGNKHLRDCLWLDTMDANYTLLSQPRIWCVT